MSKFKDFDIDIVKVKSDKIDGESRTVTTLTYTNCTCGPVCEQTFNVCTSIAYDCNTILSCDHKATCACSLDCSPTDMGMCDRRANENQGADILRRC